MSPPRPDHDRDLAVQPMMVSRSLASVDVALDVAVAASRSLASVDVIAPIREQRLQRASFLRLLTTRLDRCPSHANASLIMLCCMFH